MIAVARTLATALIATCILATAAADAPNILFITVDTLRADRLGCYGYPLPTSPNIDALARAGLVFDDLLVEAPQTGPSTIAMFTSQFPRVTGTIRNAVPLADGVPTITPFIQAAGFQTGAVVANINLTRKLSNLGAGFDTFDDHFDRKLLGPGERPADEITDAATAWLKNRDPSKPFFYWAHYIDPHSPYRFHAKFNPGKVDRRTLDRLDDTRARYDSEVAFVDHHIGRLLEAVSREDTIILLTADHGESLMEHNYLGHTRELYRNITRVPLIIVGPGIAAGRSATPARGIDIGPTLLGLAKVAIANSMRGLDLLAKTSSHENRLRVIEGYDGRVPKGPDPRERLASRPPSRQAVLDGQRKLLLRGNSVYLFDLETDPEERHNLAKSHPEETARLRAILENWNATTPRNITAAAELSESEIESLDALGYID